MPLDVDVHAAALFEGTGGPANDALWVYLQPGPFGDRPTFDAWLTARAAADDPLCYAIVDKPTASAVGLASLMRIDPANRVIEVGGIVYSSKLQRTRGATEAMFLLAQYVFEALGYRRYEWKCNALNAPSRAAAVRLGFTFEGVFRQHMIVKGHNRDSAWFSLLDAEWPARKAQFERWLSPQNFDTNDKQRTRLSESS
jgi:RimJ/RimL family protein N-acetyltransferase